jgi:tetratricopeptide (TPR) repeat protein
MRAMSQKLLFPLRLSLFAAIICVSAGWASGQFVNTGSIRGKVVQPNGNPFNEAIQVRLENIRGVKSTTFTDNQGQFNFFGLNPGIYQVVVDGDNRQDGANVTVEVFPNSPSIATVIVRERTLDPSKKATTVSTVELGQKVPSAAQKEFERGSNFAKQGKIESAITHYRKAIEIYPNFLMAHNNLGVQLMTLGKLDEATEELRKAIEIDPKAFNPRLNLGMVLVKQHNFAEGATELRKALSIDSTSASAHFYLGLGLVGMDDSHGAEKEFKAAYSLGGSKYALALFHLGELYLSRGEREAALKAFEHYLTESPNASNATHVKQMIAMLK